MQNKQLLQNILTFRHILKNIIQASFVVSELVVTKLKPHSEGDLGKRWTK